MEVTAGQRLKAIRLLADLKQMEFCELSGIDYDRLRNIEPKKQRMADEDFQKICSLLPPLSEYLTHGGTISVSALKQLDLKLARLLVMHIELGEIPTGFGLEEALVLDK